MTEVKDIMESLTEVKDIVESLTEAASEIDVDINIISLMIEEITKTLSKIAKEAGLVYESKGYFHDSDTALIITQFPGVGWGVGIKWAVDFIKEISLTSREIKVEFIKVLPYFIDEYAQFLKINQME